MTFQSLSNSINQGRRKPQTGSQWAEGVGLQKDLGHSIGLSGRSFRDLGHLGKVLPLRLCFKSDTVYIQEVVICSNWNNIISTQHEKQIHLVKSHYLEGCKLLTRQHLMFYRGGGHGRDPFWSVGRLSTWRENRGWTRKDFSEGFKDIRVE